MVKSTAKKTTSKPASTKKAVKSNNQIKFTPAEERKQRILDLMKDEMYVPMKEKELAIIMQVSESDRPAFNKALQELILENRVTISKRGKYTLSDGNTVTGTDAMIDREAGLKYTQNDSELYDTILKQFVTDAPVKREKIKLEE